MKKLYIITIFFCFSLSIFAQTDVSLKLNHKYGLTDFYVGEVSDNNLGNDFKTSRLEYYVSKISFVHDGGTETEVSLDVIDLVRPMDEISTTIELGSYDVADITQVKFYIGVYTPINNEDPSLFDVSHPLGPKSPSMHWGWVAGYRFIAYEGTAGSGFSQTFQMHGLGNENYFQVVADVDVEVVDDVMVMNLDADYRQGLKDIDISSGVISHGAIGEAKQVLENFRDYVFKNNYVGISELSSTVDWSIFPNPSVDGKAMISIPADNTVKEIKLLNTLGETIRVINNPTETQVEIELESNGVYIIQLTTISDAIETKKLVIQ
jgi:hypothetical protein